MRLLRWVVIAIALGIAYRALPADRDTGPPEPPEPPVPPPPTPASPRLRQWPSVVVHLAAFVVLAWGAWFLWSTGLDLQPAGYPSTSDTPAVISVHVSDPTVIARLKITFERREFAGEESGFGAYGLVALYLSNGSSRTVDWNLQFSDDTRWAGLTQGVPAALFTMSSGSMNLDDDPQIARGTFRLGGDPTVPAVTMEGTFVTDFTSSTDTTGRVSSHTVGDLPVIGNLDPEIEDLVEPRTLDIEVSYSELGTDVPGMTRFLRVDSATPAILTANELSWRAVGYIAPQFAYTDVAAELEESNRTFNAGVLFGIAGGVAVAAFQFLASVVVVAIQFLASSVRARLASWRRAQPRGPI